MIKLLITAETISGNKLFLLLTISTGLLPFNTNQLGYIDKLKKYTRVNK